MTVSTRMCMRMFSVRGAETAKQSQARAHLSEMGRRQRQLASGPVRDAHRADESLVHTPEAGWQSPHSFRACL